MKTTNSKIAGRVLILTFLVLGLIVLSTGKSIHVQAITCDEAFDNYINADNNYEIARWSYFYGDPTTCPEDCVNAQNYQQCVDDCMATRHTTLNNADIAMFSAANGTCAPTDYDQCASARALASGCYSQYDPSIYTDMDQYAAVAEQRWACVTATKVDYCQ